ncbi:hypothetical protein TPA0906_57790 [Streptomyces olivaceus]|nr:hypothetical protein TPA0906_57790 [Streptomyces olivaceus]
MDVFWAEHLDEYKDLLTEPGSGAAASCTKRRGRKRVAGNGGRTGGGGNFRTVAHSSLAMPEGRRRDTLHVIGCAPKRKPGLLSEERSTMSGRRDSHNSPDS